MTRRNAGRVMKRVVRLWPLWFLLLWVTIMTMFTQSSLDSHIFNLTSPLPKTPLNKDSIDKDINSIIKEELIGHQSGLSLVLRATGANLVKLFGAHKVRKIFSEVTYINLLFDDKVYVTERVNLTNPNLNENKGEVRKYFDIIRTKTGSCQKLVRIGGSLNCNKSGDVNWMDGHKILCMDAVFQIGSRNAADCVVLSYGINYDTTFDEGIANINCEVYMFDIMNYSKPYFVKENHLHFNKVGLDTEKSATFNVVYNMTTHLDNINNIVVENGIQNKLINVLKIDIEGYEWKVLHDISSREYINLVGQIAVEVHALNLLTLSLEERNKKAHYWASAIKALEARGFRIVIYWDNIQPKYTYTDVDGLTYETAGEMLLINYNWYNETFREEIRKHGYNFQ